MICPSCHTQEGTYYRIEWVRKGTRQRTVYAQGWTALNDEGCSICTGGCSPYKKRYKNGNVLYLLLPPDDSPHELNPKFK